MSKCKEKRRQSTQCNISDLLKGKVSSKFYINSYQSIMSKVLILTKYTNKPETVKNKTHKYEKVKII